MAPATSRSAKREADLKNLLRLDHSLNGGILFGLDGYIIELQARAMEVLRRPMPWTAATSVSGMANGAVTEATTRIAGAFAKLGIPDPEVEIQVNLAPASLIKEGAWLDLPMAIIMLQAAGVLPNLPEHLEGDFILMGEVGLHGEIRRVPGALSIAFVAKPGQSLIVPAGNEKECALILAKPGHEGCNVYPVSTLEEVLQFFQGKRTLENALKNRIEFESVIPKSLDFGAIKGQEAAKEAAVIAAAGGHNLLLIGPPGEGKSLLASALPGILPKLSNADKVELTKIYSAYGALSNDGEAVTRRPFRAIHHTASRQALIGGGSGIPRPGEITLAHLGILFLDEIAEFSRATLETLRQPLESGEIAISRVGATLSYPCRFTLVAAMNPCPCGYFGSDQCACKEREVANYQKKISGPLLDRIDLQVELRRLTTDERFAESTTGESATLRTQVEAARARQRNRLAELSAPFNAAMPGGHVRELCKFSSRGLEHYKAMIDSHTLSTRSMDRLAKVARTVADLASCEEINPEHLDKAGQFVIGGLLRAGR
jgi:magnesium chelatase family protein